MKTGIELIAEERQEQILKHKWSLEYDKSHKDGQLIQAAQFCQEQATGCAIEDCRWPEGWSKYFEDKIRSKTQIGKLICAGAFYMAENDRLNAETYQEEINDIAAEIDRLQA